MKRACTNNYHRIEETWPFSYPSASPVQLPSRYRSLDIRQTVSIKLKWARMFVYMGGLIFMYLGCHLSPLIYVERCSFFLLGVPLKKGAEHNSEEKSGERARGLNSPEIEGMEEANEFYLRYYVGHKGKFGHEFLEFEFRPDGKLRYANNSNYKNDTMIRKEVFLTPAVLKECKRIVTECEVFFS